MPGARATIIACRAASPPARLALGVLRGLPGALQAVLLALLHPRVAGEEAGLAEREPVACRIRLQQRAGDAVADRARLTRGAAAGDLDHDVVAALGPGHPEREEQLGLAKDPA